MMTPEEIKATALKLKMKPEPGLNEWGQQHYSYVVLWDDVNLADLIAIAGEIGVAPDKLQLTGYETGGTMVFLEEAARPKA